MRIEQGTSGDDRKVVAGKDEARQATTGHNVRYVLLFGILGVVVCFAIILIVYTQTR